MINIITIENNYKTKQEYIDSMEKINIKIRGKQFDYSKKYGNEEMYYSKEYINNTPLDKLIERDKINYDIFVNHIFDEEGD